MAAPLYDEVQNSRPDIGKDGNRGLWFERFYDQYNSQNWDVLKPDTHDADRGNTHWLVSHFANKKTGDSTALEQHAQKQMQLTKSLDGQSHVFKASWHFVTGMGNPHPVENGFAWHPTLGVPYLTGAAVKGLVRSYIENYLDEKNAANPNKKQLLLKWFGSDDKDPKKQTADSRAGGLVFFDALPVEPVTLGVDVMTPHMGKWYAEGGKRAGDADAVPADWHDPVPVSFLVAKDITLLFSFAVRDYPGRKDEPKKDESDLQCVADVLPCVADVLQRVLEHEGAGSKTSTGYGGMIDPEKQQQQEKALKEAAALAEADKMEGYLKRNRQNKSLFLERSGQKLAFASGVKAQELLDMLPDSSAKIISPSKGVKVYAYVTKKEILKVELFK